MRNIKRSAFVWLFISSLSFQFSLNLQFCVCVCASFCRYATAPNTLYSSVHSISMENFRFFKITFTWQRQATQVTISDDKFIIFSSPRDFRYTSKCTERTYTRFHLIHRRHHFQLIIAIIPVLFSFVCVTCIRSVFRLCLAIAKYVATVTIHRNCLPLFCPLYFMLGWNVCMCLHEKCEMRVQFVMINRKFRKIFHLKYSY